MMNESDDDLLSRFYMQNTAPVPAGRSYASAGSQPNAPASLASNPSGEKPNRVPLGALDLDDRNRTHAHVTHATDAKCTKLLADAESRILDERSKHQREMALREDLLKEKSRSDPAFQQNVQNLLSAFRQEAEKSAAGQYNNTAGAIQNDAKTRGGNDAADRVARLEALLAEKEQAIAAQEKRHQSERKELLALRTSQLKLESSKKGMEGELVNRAMATIAEYEAAVRQSETENSQRLSDYMDQFTRGWLNRAKDFEDNKARFEAETLDKAFMILREQETDVAKKEEGMRQHMVEILTQQSEARMDQEQRLLGQFERFKFEYKELQDRDFAKRCELFDQAHEKREQQLLERLSREREKLIQAEQQYSNAVEIQRVQCLNEAMEQVSAMRDQLLSDNQKKQEELHRQLLKQRDVMHAEMVESERQKAEHVAVMQQKVMEAMTEAHNIVASMKSQVVESEAEIHEKYMKLMLERSAALEADQQAFKDRIESGYFERVAGLNAEHGAEMKRLHDDMLMKQHSEAAEALEREQELRLSFTSRLAQCEEQVQKKYLRKLQEASDTETALQQTIQALKNEIQELLAQIKEREVLHQNREMHGEAKLLEVQRTSEAARLASEDEMRERYEKWLDDALRNGQKHSVDRMEVERMQREVAAADQRCLDLIRREREAMAGEKQHFQETCEKRIADERKRLENLEADLLDKVAGLRVELEAEMKRKEASNQRLFENERRTLYEEATERSIEERREKQAFEERVKEVEEARWKAVHVELQESCDARVRQMEAKVREREAYLDKKEAELRQHRLDHQQKVSADRARMDSDEWEARQRLEADLRKEAESRLADERARLQAELDTIRRHASEQQRSLDASRAEVQRNLQEQKLKLEQDAQAKLESMLQQAAADNREALQQTEAAFKKREKGMRQTHEKTVATMEEMHGREMHDVQDRLDHAMASIQSDKAEYEQALKAQFREREEAIRMETGARIKAEQEALRQRELQMARDNDRFRLEVEAAAREGVQQLFESRAAQLDHSEEERKKQLTGSFAKLLDKMQELDRDVQSRQREFEEDLRAKAEKALAQQREAHETATTGTLLF
ncbi:hypothetical protein DIPPA_01900 [Diplonema papillatum]|nr:hypothetical protein DIPPA_01900 [Diplonema papillatum]